VGLWNNPLELIKALAELAPEIHVRVALFNLVEFIQGLDDEAVVDAADLLEVIVQSLINLHHHVGDEDPEHKESEEDFDGMSTEDIVARFMKQLGTEEKKGDDNGSDS
jgi:hypothetical protein